MATSRRLFVPVCKMKKNDLKLILIVLCIALAGLGLLRLTKTSGSCVIVSVDGHVVHTYDLSEDGEYTISGYDGGYNQLVIQNHEAYLSDADCPDHICVKTGKIHSVGQTIVCLPHKVVVEVVNEGEDAEVDTVSQ